MSEPRVKTENDAIKWLAKYSPHIILIKWGGKAKSKSVFFDTICQREFTNLFSVVRTKITKNPSHNFTRTKEEAVAARKKTLTARYGYDNPSLIKEFQEKKKKTSLLRYGVEHSTQAEEVKRKIKSSVWNKYGVEHISQIPGTQRKIENTKIERGLTFTVDGKTLKQLAVIKNCGYTTLQQHYQAHGPDFVLTFEKNQSSLEQFVASFLSDNNIEYQQTAKLPNGMVPDFIIPQQKTIIECDGLYWHGDLIKKDRFYHKKKKDAYEKMGFSSLFFREDELNNKFPIVSSMILHRLYRQEKLYARKCSIKQGNDKINGNFFKENHLMGKGRGREYYLLSNGEPVAGIQVFWKNKKQKILEVSRFCSKTKITVVGGYSKLMNAVINTEKPFKICSFVDKRYGTGEYLKKLGWSPINNNISFCWSNQRQTFHRLAFPGNSGYERGLWKIWDCGQIKFEYTVL